MFRSSITRKWVGRAAVKGLATPPGHFQAFAGVLRRHTSSSASSGGSGKKIVGIGAATMVVGVGGVVGYAAFDKDFRQYIEDNLPGTSDVFSTIFGGKDVQVQSKPKLPLPKPPPLVTKSPEKIAAAPVPLPPIDEVAPPKKVKDESKPKKGVETTTNLKENVEKIKKLTEAAVKSGQASAEAVKTHMTLMKKVLETSSMADRDEEAWKEVFEAATVKTEALKKANQDLSEAKNAIEATFGKIQEGYKNKANTSILNPLEDEIKKNLGKLESVYEKMIEAQKEAKIIDEFRDLVEEGKRQFRLELASILPDVKLDGSEKMSEEEFNLFIQHAYKKVLFLQQELAKQKTLVQQKLKQSLERQQVGSDNETGEDIIQAALDQQRMEFETELQKKLTSIRDKLEREIRVQLKRQAAAHADHLNDVKEIYEKEFRRKIDREVNELVEREKTAAKAELAAILGTYKGIKESLETRGDGDKHALEAQQIWLAAAALHEATIKGNKPLSTALKALESVTDNSDSYIKAVLGGIPPEVKEKGVVSEESIRDRFFKVERLALQTALIGSDGGSPLKYFLSYIQNMFILSPKTEKIASKDTVINIENLSTFDIVWMARGSMNRGDLEQAVRYMTLLRGEPRNIAQDWLKEARHILEARQACDALRAHAAGIGVEVLPSKK